MIYRLVANIVFCVCFFCGVYPLVAQAESIDLPIKNIQVLTIDGAIGPATSDYIVRSVEDAQPPQTDLIVIQMNTPGGLDKSMRDMIQAILSAKAPVVSFVAPQGARAASAGTYLLYASHIAAMAPATNLGAATPVQIGSPGLPGTGKPEDKDSGEQQGQASPDPKTTMERKQINDAVAYIRGLAELHGRNADWAEEAVREASSLPANEALEKRVIDLVAADLEGLLQQIDGRIIAFNNNQAKLRLGDLVIEYSEPDWRHEFLSIITDPNVAYILLLIGIYGLVLEFYNPGMGVAGVIGAICLFLALYSFQVLPISFTGVALILLGLVLMVAEAFAPSFGVLGIGGVIAFIFGSIVLMDTELPAFQIALPVIAGVAVLSILVLTVAARMIFRSRKQQVVSGNASIIGEHVQVLAFADGRGKVRLHGELWNARSKRQMHVGSSAKVVNIDGLELEVEPED